MKIVFFVKFVFLQKKILYSVSIVPQHDHLRNVCRFQIIAINVNYLKMYCFSFLSKCRHHRCRRARHRRRSRYRVRRRQLHSPRVPPRLPTMDLMVWNRYWRFDSIFDDSIDDSMPFEGRCGASGPQASEHTDDANDDDDDDDEDSESSSETESDSESESDVRSIIVIVDFDFKFDSRSIERIGGRR